MKATIRPILIISLALWSGRLGLSPVGAQSDGDLKEWTVLVYLNGDDAPGGRENASIADFNEMEAVGSGPDVNVVVQWDREPGADLLDTLSATPDPLQNWDTVRRYLVLQDPNEFIDPLTGVRNPLGDLIFSPVLDDLGELNMGHPDTLVDFVQWGMSRFPARRYFLILWDHGNGWKPRSPRPATRGLMFDFTSSVGGTLPSTGAFLTNRDLQQALSRIRRFNEGQPLDLVGFDGAAMGSLEILYQLRDEVRYVLASSILMPPAGFPYEAFLQEFSNTPRASVDRLVDALVREYTASYRPGVGATSPSVLLGAFAVEHSLPVAEILDELAGLLLENLNRWVDELLMARAQTADTPFQVALQNPVPDTQADNVDLFDLALKLRENIDDPTLQQLVEELQQELQGPGRLVTALDKLTGTTPGEPELLDLQGPVLYFPPSAVSYDPAYEQVVDLSLDFRWDDFLATYVNLFQDNEAPQISFAFPPNGATLQNARPTIVATLTDVGGRVDPSTIELTLDQKRIDREDLTFDIRTGQLRYQPPTPLGATTHTVQLVVKDLAGNESDPAFVAFRIAPPVLRRGIQMLSIPLQLGAADPAAILGTQDFTLVRWLPTDAGSNKYRFYPDPQASLIPPDADPNQVATPVVSQPPAGLGYWIKLPLDTPVLLGAGEVVNAPNGYSVRLSTGPGNEPGWNLLGNPFNESIGWSSVQFRREGRRLTLTQAVEEGWTSGVLYGYSPNLLNPDLVGHYEFGGPGEGALEAWKAYWVLVYEDVEVIIFPGEGVGSRAASVPTISSGWQIQLGASTAHGEDPNNFLGLAEGAAEGYDLQDIAEPPALGPGGVRLAFPHPEWKGRAAGDYARDLRPNGVRQAEWRLEVQVPPDSPEVTLRWKGLPTVPPEYRLILEDETASQACFLRTRSAYRFQPAAAGETRRFRLRAERKVEGTPLEIVGLNIQPTRGDRYRIAFSLNLPATVRIRVLSPSTGQPMATVWEQTRAEGPQTATWDGRDGMGRPLPNGFYLMEVTATAETGEMRRVIGRVNLVR